MSSAGTTSAAEPVRVAILGAAGRMGMALLEAAPRTPGLRISAAVVRSEAPSLAPSAGAVAFTRDLDAALAGCDVLVDFTTPTASLEALARCRELGRPVVLGTTGFTPAQQAEVDAAAQYVALCQAANFSVGVTLLAQLVQDTAARLGSGYDVEIVEAHHRHKRDAPSGTALLLGEAAARGLGVSLADAAVYAREGQTGARPAGAIGFATVRGGDVVGEHAVLFLGDGERLELTHKASSRGNFAAGALRAAGWLRGRTAGRYSMRDVLGL